MSRFKNSIYVAAFLTTAMALSGCSSLDDEAKKPAGYLPVNDLPPPRDEKVIAPNQLTKIQAELVDSRDRQAAAAAQNTPIAPLSPAK